MSKFGSLSLPVERVARMTILHPVSRQPLRDAAGEAAYIDLLSQDSEAAERFMKEVQQRRLDMAGRGKLTSDEIEAERVEMLATLTRGWKLLGLDGSLLDVAFSAAEARALYSDRGAAWIREQVERFTADRANFLLASSLN